MWTLPLCTCNTRFREFAPLASRVPENAVKLLHMTLEFGQRLLQLDLTRACLTHCYGAFRVQDKDFLLAASTSSFITTPQPSTPSRLWWFASPRTEGSTELNISLPSLLPRRNRF
jgi:hypothetical protein